MPQCEAAVESRLLGGEEYGFSSGNGRDVGVAYKELLGSSFLTVSYSIDMATAPKNHRRL